MEESVSKKVKELLPVELSHGDIVKMVRKICDLKSERHRRKEEFRGIEKLHQIQMKELEEEIDRLFNVIQIGKEEREVECTKVINFAQGVVKYISIQTKKVILERPIKEDEKQLDLAPVIPDPEPPVASIKKCMNCDGNFKGTGRICWTCRKREEFGYYPKEKEA